MDWDGTTVIYRVLNVGDVYEKKWYVALSSWTSMAVEFSSSSKVLVLLGLSFGVECENLNLKWMSRFFMGTFLRTSGARTKAQICTN